MQLADIYRDAHLTALGSIKAKSYCPYVSTCLSFKVTCPSVGNLYEDDYRCGIARETAIALKDSKESPIDAVLKAINERLDSIEVRIVKLEKPVTKTRSSK